MEDEDGTCLLDVLCDPQALNDFLHGTNEQLQTEDLLINSSSGEPSLFADAPSPVSLLGDGGGSPGTPPPGCVDLSFLEEALLSSPEGDEDTQLGQGGTPMEAEYEGKKGEVEGADEAEVPEVPCDILQQSLQEAEITEQTMALEAGLAQSGDNLSLYSPAPLLPPSDAPFLPKSVTLPTTPVLPRDTQAAVEPPQPSLLAVGPGCPSLKPAAPPQLMGLLPGNVFPAAPPDTPFSAQGSSMIIHKAVPSITTGPLNTSSLRTTAAAPGIIFQRAPLPIQPKLPISIQPRLVQISPKPSGQKSTAGLTFVPGTASANILLSPSPGQKPAAPPPQLSQQLPKPLSLQLVNQGGSFVLQPQGLFQGQSQFLLPGQSPVTISQSVSAARPLLTTSHQEPLQSLNPTARQLLDGSQILTVPQRQLNFSPVFATPTGQLALRQATVLSGPLQLQSAPPTVFQMPAQLTGTYSAGGQGQRATLVHTPALGNHITLINSSGVLPPDLTSISIINGSSVVQGLPFTAPAPQTAGAEGQLNLQQASVVLLPERVLQEERTSSEEAFNKIPQTLGHVLQQVSEQPTSAGLQPSSPPSVSILQPPPEAALVRDHAVEVPQPLVSRAEMAQVVEEMTHSISQSEAFLQHLQQQPRSSPISVSVSVPVSVPVSGALPVAPVAMRSSPVPSERETRPQTRDPGEGTLMPGRGIEVSPLPSDPEDPPLTRSIPPLQDAEAPAHFSPPSSAQIGPGPEGSVPHQPPVQYPTSHQITKALFAPQQQTEPAVSQVQVQVRLARSSVSVSVPHPAAAGLSDHGDDSSDQQHNQHSESQLPSPLPSPLPPPPPPPLLCPPLTSAAVTVSSIVPPEPTAALDTTSKALTPDVTPARPAAQDAQDGQGPLPPAPSELAAPWRREERLTAAMRRHRFQQRICSDQTAVQRPLTRPAFSTLEDAVSRLLPYHTCAGHLPTQDHLTSVDRQFHTVSSFLLKRTKDMVNKYRQLLVREAQESPSAEMVMLERLFLQAERCALVEDRRRVRRDPESVMSSLDHPFGPSHPSASGSPSSSPSWSRLPDRPPGLKTYRSSSRGALRLTIKQESGSRKVVHNSACDLGLKRDHGGQLTNGGGALLKRVPRTVHNSKIPEPRPLAGRFAPPPGDVTPPKLKCYRSDASPRLEQRFNPREDSVLSEHLQSAIDSILELQRLQGPTAAPTRAPPGGSPVR